MKMQGGIEEDYKQQLNTSLTLASDQCQQPHACSKHFTLRERVDMRLGGILGCSCKDFLAPLTHPTITLLTEFSALLSSRYGGKE
jgi:hypothetical protein